MQTTAITIAAIILFLLLNWIKVLKEYERGVIFRLGRVLDKPKGPGLIFVLYPIDRMVKVSLRLIVLDVPPQDVITKDNISIKVNAVAYFRVFEPDKAVLEVEAQIGVQAIQEDLGLSSDMIEVDRRA